MLYIRNCGYISKDISKAVATAEAEVIELYTEDGCDRPFFCILETPGSGNVVRIVNTSPVEFPMAASVVPHSINQNMGAGPVLGGDVVIGGDVGW